MFDRYLECFLSFLTLPTSIFVDSEKTDRQTEADDPPRKI